MNQSRIFGNPNTMFTHLQSSLFKSQVNKQQQQQAQAAQQRPPSVARTITPNSSHQTTSHVGSISQQNASLSKGSMVAPSPARAGSAGGSISQSNSFVQSNSFYAASSSLPASQQLPFETTYQLDELDENFLTSLRQFGPMFCEAAQCDAWKQLCRPGHLQRKQARETKERPTIRAASFRLRRATSEAAAAGGRGVRSE